MLKAIEKILATCLYAVVLLGCYVWFYIISYGATYCYINQIVNDINFKLIATIIFVVIIFSAFLLRDLYKYSEKYKEILKDVYKS